MMSAEPLHVQVARAIGWDDIECVGWLPCNPPMAVYQGRKPDGIPILLARDQIPRFDTDWAATGPLIEKHGIGIDKRKAGWAATFFPEHLWETFVEMDDLPLVAVCRLIVTLSKAGKLKSDL